MRMPRPGRPKSPEKGEAILSAASKLFLAQGLQGTSMDAVAQRAGVSKQTVYSHFANKEELFKACIRCKVSGYGFEETAAVARESVGGELLAIVRRFMDLQLDPEVIAMYRVVIGEAATHPRIAALFFESGPRQTIAAVVGYLREEVERGRLRIGEADFPHAAFQLLGTAMGRYQMELWMGLRSSVPEDELNQHLQRVVDDFLKLYGVEER